MSEEFLTADRTKNLQRLLYATLGLAVIIALLALPGLADVKPYVAPLLVIGAVLGAVGGVALWAVRGRRESARRLCIATGVVLVVVSVPLVVILVGLLTAVLGVGLLAVVFGPERLA